MNGSMKNTTPSSEGSRISQENGEEQSLTRPILRKFAWKIITPGGVMLTGSPGSVTAKGLVVVNVY